MEHTIGCPRPDPWADVKMMHPSKVADKVTEELNSRIVPDTETASFYKIKYGYIPRIVNNLRHMYPTSDRDHYPTPNYNSLSFDTIVETPTGMMSETWYMLTTIFEGTYHPRVYMSGLGRVAIFLYMEVGFFMFGLEIMYSHIDGITYTHISPDEGI